MAEKNQKTMIKKLLKNQGCLDFLDLKHMIGFALE